MLAVALPLSMACAEWPRLVGASAPYAAAEPHVSWQPSRDEDYTGGALFSWMSFSPLKIFTAGTESVIVFFVLSGLVVSIPALKHGFDWFAYFPRRIARLMLPVIGSVLVAAAFVAAIPQNSTQEAGTWLSRSSTPSFSWEHILSAMDLFGGDAQINNPLWSLRWEVIFSLLLPVFVILAALLKRWWLAGIAGALLLTWAGISTGADSLSYLPAFFVGAMIAVGWMECAGSRMPSTAAPHAT